MLDDIEKGELREQAKRRLEMKEQVQFKSAADETELIQELSIQHEELEIQNEELRRAQVELEASRTKYYRWYDLAPVGYLTVSPDLVITEANLTASSLLGTERDEMIGRGISAFFPAKSQELLYLHYRRVAAGKGKQKHSLTLRSENEGEHMIQLASDLIEDGPEQGFRTILTDVTASRRLEMEMARNEKLESLGVLAGGIAHDFNNMLASIVSNIEIAMIELPESSKPRRRLEDSVRSAMRARNLTQQLLAFTKGGQPLKEVLDLKYLVRSSAEFSLAGSNVEADFEIEKRLRMVSADPIQIEQVISNLIVNAVQAMPQGGRILVKASNMVPSENEKTSIGPGPFVRIDIKDEGEGIPAEIIDRIFDPFFTTKPTGSGLGLSTVRSIVQNHGGMVLVDSTLGKGTAVSIILPAQVEVRQEAVPVKPKAESHRSGRVLVMDDDETILEIMPLLLSHLGYKSACVVNGADAIATYKDGMTAGRPFMAVIMDLTVKGGMGGEEAVREILALDPNAWVIVSSGYSSDPIMSSPKEFGFRDVLQKPFTMLDLSAKLASASDERNATEIKGEEVKPA